LLLATTLPDGVKLGIPPRTEVQPQRLPTLQLIFVATAGQSHIHRLSRQI
jgi:hypothetical protein